MGLSGLRATLEFLRNPERFAQSATTRWGTTFRFRLAGRNILATGDPVLAAELFGTNSDGIFFPEPLFEVLGNRSILHQEGVDHARTRALLRFSMMGIALNPIAKHEASLMAQTALEPLQGDFRVDLMPSIRRYMLLSTLQMLTGNMTKQHKEFVSLWEAWTARLHPLLMFPPHPWIRFSCWGHSPWDRCRAARDQVRTALVELADQSTEGYPAHRLKQELGPEELVDQLLTIVFGSVDNPSIVLARMLAEFQTEQGDDLTLFDRVLDQHPPMPFIPHGLRKARPDLGLAVGDGVALLPGVLQNKTAFGFGPHRCLGMAWARVLLLEAMRMFRPHLQGHRLEMGPSVRQRFSWGPNQIWLSRR